LFISVRKKRPSVARGDLRFEPSTKGVATVLCRISVPRIGWFIAAVALVAGFPHASQAQFATFNSNSINNFSYVDSGGGSTGADMSITVSATGTLIFAAPAPVGTFNNVTLTMTTTHTNAAIVTVLGTVVSQGFSNTTTWQFSAAGHPNLLQVVFSDTPTTAGSGFHGSTSSTAANIDESEGGGSNAIISYSSDWWTSIPASNSDSFNSSLTLAHNLAQDGSNNFTSVTGTFGVAHFTAGSAAQTPEPNSLLLAGAAFLAMGVIGRFRRSKGKTQRDEPEPTSLEGC
jgi:hypothetical protein